MNVLLNDFINITLPSIGIGLASITDDVSLKFGPLATGVFRSALSAAALIFTVPFSIKIYSHFLRRALEKNTIETWRIWFLYKIAQNILNIQNNDFLFKIELK